MAKLISLQAVDPRLLAADSPNHDYVPEMEFHCHCEDRQHIEDERQMLAPHNSNISGCSEQGTMILPRKSRPDKPNITWLNMQDRFSGAVSSDVEQRDNHTANDNLTAFTSVFDPSTVVLEIGISQGVFDGIVGSSKDNYSTRYQEIQNLPSIMDIGVPNAAAKDRPFPYAQPFFAARGGHRIDATQNQGTSGYRSPTCTLPRSTQSGLGEMSRVYQHQNILSKTLKTWERDEEQDFMVSVGSSVPKPVRITMAPSDPSLTHSLPKTAQIIVRCEVCGTEFKGRYAKGNKSRHYRSKHSETGLMVYTCHYNGCGRKYRRKDARLKHYRKDHPSIPNNLRGNVFPTL